MKTQLLNIFSSTCFKKYQQLLLDQNENGVKKLQLFFLLPATLDRKEEILQYKDNVHLHPIDFDYDYFKNEVNADSFDPSMLEKGSVQQRMQLRSAICKIMKHIAMLSNQNLIRNVQSYLARGFKIDPEKEFVWIDESQKQSTAQLQLHY